MTFHYEILDISILFINTKKRHRQFMNSNIIIKLIINFNQNSDRNNNNNRVSESNKMKWDLKQRIRGKK